MAAVLFDEPESEAVGQAMQTGLLFAPPLLAIELASICLKKMRRHPERLDDWVVAFSYRESFGVTEYAVDADAVFILARSTGLTAYDACYLWLARHLNAELVTLDEQLARAAV